MRRCPFAQPATTIHFYLHHGLLSASFCLFVSRMIQKCIVFYLDEMVEEWVMTQKNPFDTGADPIPVVVKQRFDLLQQESHGFSTMFGCWPFLCGIFMVSHLSIFDGSNVEEERVKAYFRRIRFCPAWVRFVLCALLVPFWQG